MPDILLSTYHTLLILHRILRYRLLFYTQVSRGSVMLNSFSYVIQLVSVEESFDPRKSGWGPHRSSF